MHSTKPLLLSLWAVLLLVGIGPPTGGAYGAEEGAKLPHLVRGTLDHPERAKRLNQQGRILVEFRVSGPGR